MKYNFHPELKKNCTKLAGIENIKFILKSSSYHVNFTEVVSFAIFAVILLMDILSFAHQSGLLEGRWILTEITILIYYCTLEWSHWRIQGGDLL